MSALSRSLAAVLAVVLAQPLTAAAQEVLSAEEEASNRLGFYFALSLESATPTGMANGIGVLVDRDSAGNFDVVGPELDGGFGNRSNFGFTLGFRLRQQRGNIEASYFQFDEREDLFRDAGAGKGIANTLASPEAGFFEDQGFHIVSGPPDGTVSGIEAGLLSEGSDPIDFGVLDGAEDINYNGRADFLRFDSSDRLVGELDTDYKLFDLDYVRTLKRLPRLRIDWRAGLRFASLRQLTDVGYRQLGSFAVYDDTENDPSSGSVNPCGRGFTRVQDGDGDGENQQNENERDGDGFLDGDCDNTLDDEILSVPTLSEDRIVAQIDSQGYGLKLGLDGTFKLSKKWRLNGGFAVGLMATDVDYRYREVFVSERDRYPNFIDWDLNGDGKYDNLDLDFDGSCQGVAEGCVPNLQDELALLGGMGVHDAMTRMRAGVANSVVSNPQGTQSNAYNSAFGNLGLIRRGDPIPESERNTDILRETILLQDVRGDDSGLKPMLDVHVGAQYQFSRFARLDFGLKASRWFGAGRFRELANDVILGGEVDIADGDFATEGYYIRLTVVPR